MPNLSCGSAAFLGLHLYVAQSRVTWLVKGAFPLFATGLYLSSYRREFRNGNVNAGYVRCGELEYASMLSGNTGFGWKRRGHSRPKKHEYSERLRRVHDYLTSLVASLERGRERVVKLGGDELPS